MLETVTIKKDVINLQVIIRVRNVYDKSVKMLLNKHTDDKSNCFKSLISQERWAQSYKTFRRLFRRLAQSS
jgi:hypothetical protein